jgi:hypothetical protein
MQKLEKVYEKYLQMLHYLVEFLLEPHVDMNSQKCRLQYQVSQILRLIQMIWSSYSEGHFNPLSYFKNLLQ